MTALRGHDIHRLRRLHRLRMSRYKTQTAELIVTYQWCDLVDVLSLRNLCNPWMTWGPRS